MSVRKRAVELGNALQEEQKHNLYNIVFPLLIIGIIPLITWVKIVSLSDVEKVFFNDQSKVDLFTYYKMMFLLIFTSLGFLVFIFNRKDGILDRGKKLYYVPAGIYAAFVILSAAVSQYKTIAFWGFFSQYEGAFVLLAYIVLMLLSMNLFEDERNIKKALACLLASSAVISVIGLLQYLGINPVSAFAAMTVPKNVTLSITSVFGPKTVGSTLFNPNYVGSYMAMLLPIVLLLFIWVKKIPYNIMLAILLGLVIINWIACDSRAGIVGGIAALLVIVAMYRKKIFKHKLIVASTAVLLCAGLVVLNFATNGSVVERLKRITSISAKDTTAVDIEAYNSVIKGLSDISMNKDRARFVTDKGTLQVVLLDSGEIKLLDENNKELEFSLDNDNISINDNRFNNIKLENKSQDGTMIVYYNNYKLIDIVFTKDGLMSTYNRWMPYRNDKEIKRFGFEGMETLGSNRGYIWSRTIPLLKSTIFFGHGPDTFSMYFPQYDYIGKLRNYQTGSIFIDKPHDYYLQTAMNTGIISLIALLALFGIYFVSSIRIYIKEEFTTLKSITGLACFAAFCSYVVSGIFNDSVVSVAPVFWFLFGTGIGINISLIKDKNILMKEPGKAIVATGKSKR